MAPKKYYAVAKGRLTGIFTSWDECKKQVDGFSAPIYKSFKSLEEAKEFLEKNMASTNHDKEIIFEANNSFEREIKELYKKLDEKEALAFVDGSFLKNEKSAGYGLVYVKKGSYKLVSENAVGDLSLRNVLGEILAAMEAVKLAIEDGLDKISIYYDYTGLEYWANGSWKRNNSLTKTYFEFMQEAKKQIKIEFFKVEAHKGIILNEKADSLAKAGALKK